MNGMNFLDLVKARYSVRSYRPQAVEREKVEYLLECARLAPSAILRRGERCAQGGPATLLSPRVVRRSAALHRGVRRRVGVVEA